MVGHREQRPACAISVSEAELSGNQAVNGW
jgi:hypothetical protein